MNGINDRYNIKLEILTPLHIGAGAEKDLVEGVDYVIKDNCFYKIDLNELFKKVDINKLSAIISNKDNKCSYKLLQLIGNNLDSLSTLKIEMPYLTKDPIKTFIKNQLTDKPVVPGSSIKGAIRSILFGILNSYKSKDSKIEKVLFGRPEKGEDLMRFIKISDIEFIKDVSYINTKIFNLVNEKGEWKGAWKNGPKLNEFRCNENMFNTVCEALLPESVGIGNMMFSPELFNKVVNKNDNRLKFLDTYALFNKINERTREYLRKELKFFENFYCDNTTEICKAIIDKIIDLIAKVPVDGKSCIFRMSYGSGFNSITGDWQFDDFINGQLGRKKNKEALPKSRKIAIFKSAKDGVTHYWPMGFVRLSIVDDKPADDYNAKRIEELEKIANIRIVKKNKEKHKELLVQIDRFITDRKYKDAVESLRSAMDLNVSDNKHLEIEIDDLLNFMECLEGSETLIDNGDLIKAKDKLLEAKALNVNRKDVEERICLVDQKLKGEELKRLISEAKESLNKKEYDIAEMILNEAFMLGINTDEIQQIRYVITQEKKSKNIGDGLLFLEKKNVNGEFSVTDFKSGKARIDKWMKQSNNESIPQSEEKRLIDFLKRIYPAVTKRDKREWETIDSKVWKEVGRWCGKEKVETIFNIVVVL